LSRHLLLPLVSRRNLDRSSSLVSFPRKPSSFAWYYTCSFTCLYFSGSSSKGLGDFLYFPPTGVPMVPPLPPLNRLGNSFPDEPAPRGHSFSSSYVDTEGCLRHWSFFPTIKARFSRVRENKQEQRIAPLLFFSMPCFPSPRILLLIGMNRS